jgi:hypothetical protein
MAFYKFCCGYSTILGFTKVVGKPQRRKTKREEKTVYCSACVGWRIGYNYSDEAVSIYYCLVFMVLSSIYVPSGT